jgi:hypothetical protein
MITILQSLSSYVLLIFFVMASLNMFLVLSTSICVNSYREFRHSLSFGVVPEQAAERIPGARIATECQDGHHRTVLGVLRSSHQV